MGYPARCFAIALPYAHLPTAKTLSNQRPKAATYLCRFAAKARFDNRPNPRRVFPKREGSQPLPFGRFKGKRFLRKGGNRNPPFLKPFFGYFLSGKKVTRRRQKKKGAERKYPAVGKKRKRFGADRVVHPYALK